MKSSKLANELRYLIVTFFTAFLPQTARMFLRWLERFWQHSSHSSSLLLNLDVTVIFFESLSQQWNWQPLVVLFLKAHLLWSYCGWERFIATMQNILCYSLSYSIVLLLSWNPPLLSLRQNMWRPSSLRQTGDSVVFPFHSLLLPLTFIFFHFLPSSGWWSRNPMTAWFFHSSVLYP